MLVLLEGKNSHRGKKWICSKLDFSCFRIFGYRNQIIFKLILHRRSICLNGFNACKIFSRYFIFILFYLSFYCFCVFTFFTFIVLKSKESVLKFVTIYFEWECFYFSFQLLKLSEWLLVKYLKKLFVVFCSNPQNLFYSYPFIHPFTCPFSNCVQKKLFIRHPQFLKKLISEACLGLEWSCWYKQRSI